MAASTSSRTVRLVDVRDPARPIIPATLRRDYPAAALDTVEHLWAKAREDAANAAPDLELVLEHAHWNWRNKADTVMAGIHMLVAIECEGEPQGIMAVLRSHRTARLGEGEVVYVDYLEAAPWNLRGWTANPRFAGVGTVLLADAVRLSAETGVGGAVGLHSLSQAEPFYARCRMTRLGPDLDYYDLTYFEFTSQQAMEWLATIGETL